MAERVGFEPTVPCGTPHFQCGAFDHSTISPQNRLKTVRNYIIHHLCRFCQSFLQNTSLFLQTVCPAANRLAPAIPMARLSLPFTPRLLLPLDNI